MKKAAWLLVRMLISAALMWLLLAGADASGGVAKRLRLMPERWGWVALGLASIAASHALAGLRWWLVLKPLTEGREMSLGFAMRHVLIAGFFNISSFGTVGGDAWRVMALRKAGGGCAATGGTSIIADHAAGAVGMLVYFGVVSTCVLASAGEAMAHSLRLLAGVLLAVTVLSALLFGTLTPAFVGRFGRYAPKLVKPMVEAMSAKFGLVLNSWRSLLMAGVVSVLMLTFYFLAFHCGLRAVGYESSALPVMVAMPATDLAASLPVSLSGIGVREKTFESLLALLNGTPGDISVAGSLAGWAFTVVWGCIGGLLFAFGPASTKEIEPVTAA